MFNQLNGGGEGGGADLTTPVSDHMRFGMVPGPYIYIRACSSLSLYFMKRD